MNGPHKNSEVFSQAGIRQEYVGNNRLVEQLLRQGISYEECRCQKLVFSEPFFIFVSLFYIFSVIGTLVTLYFWGEVFYVKERPETTTSSERKEVVDPPVAT